MPRTKFVGQFTLRESIFAVALSSWFLPEI